MEIIDHLSLFRERNLTEEDLKRIEEMSNLMKSLRKSLETNIVFSVKSVDGEDIPVRLVPVKNKPKNFFPEE